MHSRNLGEQNKMINLVWKQTSRSLIFLEEAPD